MNSDILESIREAEKASHTDVYTNSKLFEKGSWLAKPDKNNINGEHGLSGHVLFISE